MGALLMLLVLAHRPLQANLSRCTPPRSHYFRCMIRYSLKCAEGHGFESWFKSADAYDTLHKAGQVACPSCGSAKVEKALMAPQVSASEDKAPLSKQTEVEAKIKELRDHVEANSDYVGGEFATEARAMYLGDKPSRAIYGEAKPEEAKSLIEDGVPVAPLPFKPTRKAN